MKAVASRSIILPIFSDVPCLVSSTSYVSRVAGKFVKMTRRSVDISGEISKRRILI